MMTVSFLYVAILAFENAPLRTRFLLSSRILLGTLNFSQERDAIIFESFISVPNLVTRL